MPNKIIIVLSVSAMVIGGFLFFRTARQETAEVTSSETTHAAQRETVHFTALTGTQLAAMAEQ